MRYPKIHLKDKKIVKLINKRFKPDEPVYVREKIHGANFSILLDVKKMFLTVFKRTGPISKPFPFDMDG